MDLEKYPYRATFTSFAKIVNPSEQDRFVAKAALAPLRALLPPDIDPEKDTDLLWIAADGATGGLKNRNDDALSGPTAIAVHRTAKNKYISTDHDRGKVIGVVLYPGLSRFGTNEPLTDEQAAASNEPFNMSFAGVLWRLIDPMTTKYLSNVGGVQSEDALSMSWEIAFERFDCAVAHTPESENVFDADIIPDTDPRFQSYSKLLRANGGDGKDARGHSVFRVISGDPVILGYSVVARPAALVKGILPIEKLADPVASTLPAEALTFLENEPESGMGYHLCDVTMKDGAIHANVVVLNRRILPSQIDVTQVASVALHKKSDEKNITQEKACVTQPTIKAMKISIASVEDLSAKWDEVSKLPKEEALASIQGFVDAINDGAKTFIKEKETLEALVREKEQVEAAAAKQVEKVQAEVKKLREELAEERATREQGEAAAKFTERMASFDTEYELDDEDRKFLAADIKDLDDDSFAAYSSKCKKLMAAKSKSKKAPPFVKKDDDDKDDKSKALFNDSSKKSKSDDDDGDDDADAAAKAALAAQAKEALASVVEDKTQAKLPNSQVVVDATVQDQMAAAFGASFKIDGKTVAERKSKKNQKQA